MSKKVLVTGGAGFIGSALVKTLVKNGYDVRVYDNGFRDSKHRLKTLGNEVEFIKGDIRDFHRVCQAMSGIDMVIHLACINGTEFFYTMPDTVLDVSVKGTMNAIDACLKEGVRDFLFASSSEVYQTPPRVPTPEDVRLIIPDPLNPRYSYAGGKIIGELLTLNFGQKFFNRAIVFRPHNVYGPDMGWKHVIPQFVLRMKKLSDKNKKDVIDFPIQGSGKETRSFCYIDDFVDGLIKVIQFGKHMEIYNIGIDKETRIQDLATKIAKYFHRTIKLIPDGIAMGGTLTRCPDISKLRKLGYDPKVTLSKGLGITASWYITNAQAEPSSHETYKFKPS